MNPLGSLPKPLSQAEFYVLLALLRGESSRYALIAVTSNDSLGSLNLAASQVYRAVEYLHDTGYVDLIRSTNGRAGQSRRKYFGISESGLIRLQEEILRLDHAVRIARNAGIMDDETPTDIQRLRLELLDGGKG